MSSVNILSGVSGDYITKSITDNKTTKTQDTGTFDELYQSI